VSTDRLLARVTTIEAEASDEVLAVRERVIREAAALPGFRGALDLVDRESGRQIAVTLWESEQALRASERARPARDGLPKVEVYEARWYAPTAAADPTS
jgi:heme-degrading monooxygenase HmoA